MRNEGSKGFAISVTFLFALFVTQLPCFAANHFVRQGSTGNGSGADWTNACVDFTGSCAPSALVRGDTYYMASGSYLPNGITWSAAESGTTVITIKRATTTDHGTSTGWLDSFDGQVNFSGDWNFNTGYWTFEGQTGNAIPPAPSVAFGFQLINNEANTNCLVCTNTANNLTFLHFRISGQQCCNADYNGPYGILAQGGNNLLFQYGEVDHTKSDLLHINSTTNTIIDHTFLSTNEGGLSDNHGQGIWNETTNGFILRYSMMQDAAGTAYFSCGSGASALLYCNNVNIYGNVFYHTRTHPQNTGGVEATYLIECIYSTASNSNPCNGMNFYNNTITNFDDNDSGLYFDSLNKNFTWENNLWFNINCAHGGGGTCFISMPTTANGTHDYNTFAYIQSNVSLDTLNAHEFSSTSNTSPFVAFPTNLNVTADSAIAHLNDGIALSAPFNIDPNGNTRGSDGTWERGAYEFAANSATGPQPPTNVSATVH